MQSVSPTHSLTPTYHVVVRDDVFTALTPSQAAVAFSPPGEPGDEATVAYASAVLQAGGQGAHLYPSSPLRCGQETEIRQANASQETKVNLCICFWCIHQGDAILAHTHL